ncbi:DMT family transporter [Fusibacter ferrireducens]|uniref:EamA family transporter n=1 Tax=Fusibacter ferrireducens TaxID=2785058 RepID=A0ABR9ZSP1_9FIRM|nr:DMT family transporter [Fusibacter ferrireducens]MBF4693467.1 EamA family transporter [Fusibacter ferrireducens]
MSLIAFLFVILSTIMHAYWNYVLKKVQGGILFVWLFTLMACILYVPVIALILIRYPFTLTPLGIFFCTLSVLAHIFYFVFLDQAYRIGDLSIIYPVTRGVSPVFTVLFAIFFLGESLQGIQFIGIAMILMGTMTLSGLQIKNLKRSPISIGFALLCGLMVTIYTLSDKYTMSVLLISPLILDFLNNLGRTVILTPLVIKSPHKAKHLFQNHFKEALIIAVLSPLTYVLVLFAMKTLPVSIIAPIRQLSIIFSSILGINLLSESKDYAKIGGVLLTFLGVVAMCVVV